MSSTEWQIVATAVLAAGSPFVAARLAVSRLGRELDNARLDELRGVLDEAVIHLAHADRLQTEGSRTFRTLEEPPTAAMDVEIDALIDLYWRLQLRLGDDPVTAGFMRALSEFQNVRNALLGPADGPGDTVSELRLARKAFGEAHIAVLMDARELVGPSARALRRSRSSVSSSVNVQRISGDLSAPESSKHGGLAP